MPRMGYAMVVVGTMSLVVKAIYVEKGTSVVRRMYVIIVGAITKHAVKVKFAIKA